MIGYLTAGITINFFNAFVTWRFSIQIQGFVQIPLSLYFYFEDEKYINIETTNDEHKSELIRKSMVENLTAHRASISDRKSKLSPTYRNSNILPRPQLHTEIGSPEHRNRDNPFEMAGSPRTEKRKSYLHPNQELTKHVSRMATRIDAIEINELARYCSQTKVFIFYFILGSYK